MAGIEELVVHSKSYVVRWVQVAEFQSISWSVQPHKKSINLGIVKHPGNKSDSAQSLPAHDTIEAVHQTPLPDETGATNKKGRKGSYSKSEASNALEKLQSAGLRCVAWTGNCEADKVSIGVYDVAEGEGGMYGLVFDNTFSKQTSKTVHFVMMTYATNAPPKSGHHMHYALMAASAPSPALTSQGYSPSLRPINDSNESLPGLHRGVLDDPRPVSKKGTGVEVRGVEGTTFYTGTLLKKRRKKGQGFAKRFFSLDFTSTTLSYYQNRHSSALRGAVPLSLVAIGANDKTREFSIDSGAEVWHLKAPDKVTFDGWREALERAANADPGVPSGPTSETTPSRPPRNPYEDHEWQQIEELVSKVAGTRDAVRGLAKDTDPKYLANGTGLGLGTTNHDSGAPSPSSYDSHRQSFLDAPEERPNASSRRPSFWKRKSSAERSPAGLMRRSVSTQLGVPSPSLVGPTSGGTEYTVPRQHYGGRQPSLPGEEAADVHERCMALLRDLDTVVTGFAALIAASKNRRLPTPMAPRSRKSFESSREGEDEFFDAEDGEHGSQLLRITRTEEDDSREGDGDDDGERDDRFSDAASEADSDASEDGGDASADSRFAAPKQSHGSIFPDLPKELSPLPLDSVKRRTAIGAPKQAPPSIIGFLRKNAGKDLSTVSMPVTANEPTSLLQRLAESMEYSTLLDKAAQKDQSPEERLMYVTAFAVSYFANNRVKERAIRKPFNPMLGETFELVREDLGFRFLAEKVSHHPVKMACQAESLKNGGWCFAQAPRPVQKFWGKSVELNTEGRARVLLYASNERYSWNQATCFLRNVIAGEKYVEPVQSMTVQCESNGMRAVISFKSGGMFSGRSEDVNVQFFDPSSGDAPLKLGLTGKWTDGLSRTDNKETIWSVGDLVPDAPKAYGFPTFAAALNEITAVEKDKLPPTDSRLRPDQQALEAGDVDRAEATKARLEERQRARRKVLESHGQNWTPQFFEKLADDESPDSTKEEVWVLKQQGNYWDRRAKNEWEGVQEVFET